MTTCYSLLVILVIATVAQAVIIRNIDYLDSSHRCQRRIQVNSAGSCGTTLVSFTTTVIGGGRELFVEANETLYGPEFPVEATGVITTEVLGNLRKWQTTFGAGIAGISEYTLDGFDSDPNTIDPEPPFGLSPGNGNDTDLTERGGWAFVIEYNSQIATAMNISVFDNTFNLAFYELPIVSNVGGSTTTVLIPYSSFQDLNATTTDFQLAGAIDLFIYAPKGIDASLEFFAIFANLISGIVYTDCGTACTNDINDNLLSGVIIELYESNTLVDTTTTNSNGFYQFTVDPGNYRVCLSAFYDDSDVTCLGSICRTVNIPNPPLNIPNGDLSPYDYPNNNFPITPVSRMDAPPPTTLTCGAPTGFTGNPTFTTGCSGGTPGFTYEDSTVPLCSSGSARVITREYIATDSSGLTSIQFITVEDQAVPNLFNVPSARSVTCGACTTTACLGFPSANDDCSTPSVQSGDLQPTPDDCDYTFVRLFTATDACGKTNTASQIIRVFDDAAPSFSNVPSNRPVDCNQLDNPGVVGANPSGNDACNNGAQIIGPVVSTTQQCGQITRTWTVEDDCGNAASTVQILNVQDTQSPTIIPPNPTTLICGQSTANLGTPTFDDNCALALATGITVLSGNPQGGCGSFVRQFTAYDGCNPTVTAFQTITIQDNTPPVFNPTSIPRVNLNCGDSTANISPSTVSASDDCSGINGPVSLSTSSTVGGACGYTFNRVWSATNNCGASSSITQLVSVSDNTPPVLTIPASTTLDCAASRQPTPTAAGTATASDACGFLQGNPTYSEVNNGPGCVFTIARTWTVADTCGNTSPAQTQILTIRDNSAPTFSFFPANTSIGCTQSTSTSNAGIPNGSDNCNGLAPLTWQDSINDADCPNLLIIQRTWTISDVCEQATSRVQIISIVDNQPPSIDAPDSITLPCGSNYSSPPLSSAVASFICAGEEGDISYSDDIDDGTACTTIVTRTWTIRDDCGGTDSDVQLIYLTDNIAPTFDSASLPPLQIEISCSDPLPQYQITGSDNCDPSPDIQELPPSSTDLASVGRCPANTRITRTWVIRDNCGLSSSFTQTVIVDNTPVAPCRPVDCIEQPCDTSVCPSQDCDCCRGDILPCNPVNCQAANCIASSCTPVPCSGCDFPTRVTSCQPKVCPPQYIFIDDDDAAAMNRGPVSNLKQVKTFPGVSAAGHAAVSILLLVIIVASAFVALF